ncbi:23S rRNA (adenine(1618)-N(6))-methyltransferase RlmF [Arcobacter sp. 15-2]|uniref:23S rRNA (adenine(1618)-N(6))-methyltransferase RlmF n=1 Tax=Arcobacter sp. 15-2 TaxID=3374109 RepID=UPI00399C780E
MKTLHPRNLHNERYDFGELINSSKELAHYIKKNQYGDLSIDFHSNDAVMALNKALLKHFYQIDWKIPKKYLCPPIPGRVDYIHYLADLLAKSNSDIIPKGNSIKALDVGVGANCIYPIVGNRSYEWKFIGSDIDAVSIKNAQDIVDLNHSLKNKIELRTQSSKEYIFTNIIKKNDKIDFTMCNPPFHKSKKEAKEGTKRKLLNLSKGKNKKVSLNFGGQHNELWCEGGEVSFISKMINESKSYKDNCLWFTSLVSKKENLEAIYKELKKQNPEQIETIEMTQGQKQTRFVAWTYYTKEEQKNWFENKEK